MKRNYVLNKLVLALAELSDHDLRELSSLLRHPDVSTSIACIIDETIHLREMERRISQSGSSISASEATGEAPSRTGTLGQDKGQQSIRDVFHRTLSDKGAFPSTRDVVDAINDVLGETFKYQDFKRNGRRPLIRKAWRVLETRSRRSRVSAIRRLMRAVPSPEAKEYRDLFRMLTRNE